MGFPMKTWELISIVLSALVAGMFHGPWIALSRSMSTFGPEVFLAIVERMNCNMAPVMTVLMPAALLSIIAVMYLSYHERATISN
jgi:ABC-type sulfate transport system permease component